MALDAHTLVSYQRAELAKAERLRIWLLGAQLLAVAPVIASVLFEDSMVLYYLALVSPIFLVAWAILYHRCHLRRAAGEAARRATYVVGGRGSSLSKEEKLRLLDKFDVSQAGLQRFENREYFASAAAPSDERVGEMLTESVFYSKRIQAECAKITIALVAVIIVVFAAVGMLVLPLTDTSYQVKAARVFFGILVFLFSYDVFGAIYGHVVAWIELKAILARLEVAAARAYPHMDTLVLVGDYCSTMEKAPLTLPYVYSWQKPRLNRLWATYVDARNVPAPPATAST